MILSITVASLSAFLLGLTFSTSPERRAGQDTIVIHHYHLRIPMNSTSTNSNDSEQELRVDE